jgi:hypothetical protein
MISSVSSSIASITLIDGSRKEMKIPSNIRLRNLENNEFSPKIEESFFITWFGSYCLADGNTELLRMTNEATFNYRTQNQW